MEREAFRQRMQQYKQARENNPQLKYWDWKKYADGGTIEEDPPTTSERPIINFNPKGNPYEAKYGYNPGDKVDDVPNFFMHLQAAPDEYKGIKLLQNLFKTDRAFKKRFDQIPLTNINDNRVVA